MKVQTRELLLTLALAIMVTGPMLSKATAQTANGLAATEAIADSWWYHGYVEVGGRFFVNNPQKDGVKSQGGGESLAKFYEYRDLRPGPFGNFGLSAGTKNGVYEIDVSGKNVGYDDQHFNLDASKAGEHYFNFQWDETPHVYSDSARTIYNGVGTNALTLPAGLSNKLFGDTGCTAVVCDTLTPAQAAAVQKDIKANLHQTNIGIRRDTASVEYRWTPTTAWDFKADYSQTHRWGTQVDGVVFAPDTEGVVSQVPRPVNDTTHNYGLNGEYAGTSPWGQMFTFKVGYIGSLYKDAWNSYTVENPFCPTGGGFGTVAGACAGPIDPGPPVVSQQSNPIALVALWPDNQANGFNATLGANLPFESRYMGTVSYNMMRQNQALLPFTLNPFVSDESGAPVAVPAAPVSSLNGAINTFLSNNVLTTQITPTLKSKLSYRYYKFDNDTPEIFLPVWVREDSRLVEDDPVHTLSISYIKQNAGEDLNWRPSNEWNFGAAYGYERYDWTRTDVDVTKEHSGKVYADWKPTDYIMARASWVAGWRRYNTYDYLDFVGLFQWPISPPHRQSTAMRQYMFNNRDRNKGIFSVSFVVIDGLTVTPTFGYLDDVYHVGPGEVGLTHNEKWSTGVELTYLLNPDTRLFFAYMNEQSAKNLSTTTAVDTEPLAPDNRYSADIKDTVNTFTGAVNFAAIPDKLDLKVRYSVSLAKNSQPVVWGITPADFVQYPDVRTTWQQLDASAKYTFDQDAVRNLGLKGRMFAKLRYVWERNSVDNWQNDIMKNYMYPVNSDYGFMTWLAYNNPNYNVQMIMASLGFKW